jgi:hypothetical protein
VVTFSHTDAGTDEAAWAAGGLDTIGELPLDAAEFGVETAAALRSS